VFVKEILAFISSLRLKICTTFRKLDLILSSIITGRARPAFVGHQHSIICGFLYLEPLKYEVASSSKPA
jgi:hypothetical protein